MSVWMSRAEKVAYVKSQHQSRPHTCHWPGCGRQVPPALWGCSFHWRQLPRDLRERIWNTYRPGQEKTMTPSRGYLAVCEEVEKFFQDAGLIGLKPRKIVGRKTHDSKSTGEKKMKITLHLEGTRQEILTQIDEARLVVSSSLAAQPPKGEKKAAVRSKKAKEEEDEIEADEEESDEEAEQDEDDADSEEEDEEESEEEADEDSDESEDEDEEDAPKPPKKEAVVKALKDFAAKGKAQKDKAMKALSKFKVKHVDDLDKKNYAALLKLLK